jgi:hypothetical protein
MKINRSRNNNNNNYNYKTIIVTGVWKGLKEYGHVIRTGGTWLKR